MTSEMFRNSEELAVLEDINCKSLYFSSAAKDHEGVNESRGHDCLGGRINWTSVGLSSPSVRT